MFKFKINNRNWKIIEASQAEMKTKQNMKRSNEDDNIKSTNPRYYGITYFDELVIYLDEALPIDVKRATLIHELTHCFINNYITHQDKNYDEEMVCDIVANSHDIITEIIDKYFL